jgi:uncharacterized membrane protein
MTLGRIAYALAVVAVLCVLTVFFFHAIRGPYSAVHGPVTALLSLRAASGLRMSIMRAGLSTWAMRASLVIVLVSFGTVWLTEFAADSLPGSGNQILRC